MSKRNCNKLANKAMETTKATACRHDSIDPLDDGGKEVERNHALGEGLDNFHGCLERFRV